MSDKKVIYLDASALKKSACKRRVFWHAIEGYTLRGGMWERNYKAAYGTAFHKVYQRIVNGEDKHKAIQYGLEYYRPFEPFISQAPKEFRTPEHLESVLKTYFFRQYKVDHMVPMLTPEGKPLTEIKFQYPYYEDENFVLYITGTIDLISVYLGRPCVTDHKVTGANKPEDFFFDFEFNIQSLMYVWQYYMLTGQILPFLVNGIFIKKPTDKAMEKGQFDGVNFQRNTPLEFDMERIMQFQNRFLYPKLNGIIESYKKGTIKDEYDMSCCHGQFFEVCPFFNVCRLGESLHDMILNSQYEKHHYNPLLFQD